MSGRWRQKQHLNRDTFAFTHSVSPPTASAQWMQLIASEEHSDVAIDVGHEVGTVAGMASHQFHSILSSAVDLH